MNEGKIVLEVRRAGVVSSGDVIKITPAARAALNRLIEETGLSARYIASALITQGENLVEIVEV